MISAVCQGLLFCRCHFGKREDPRDKVGRTPLNIDARPFVPYKKHFLWSLVNSELTNQHQYLKFFACLTRHCTKSESAWPDNLEFFLTRPKLNVSRLRQPGAVRAQPCLFEILAGDIHTPSPPPHPKEGLIWSITLSTLIGWLLIRLNFLWFSTYIRNIQ